VDKNIPLKKNNADLSVEMNCWLTWFCSCQVLPIKHTTVEASE